MFIIGTNMKHIQEENENVQVICHNVAVTYHKRKYI